MSQLIIKMNQFEHGGSRIYFEDKDGECDRYLLVDTYRDVEFAKYIKGCVEKYFYPQKEKT